MCSESPSSFLSGGRQAQRAVGASLKRAGGGMAGGVLRERWWAGGPLRSDRPVLGQRPRRNNSPGLAVEAGTEKTREPEGVWDLGGSWEQNPQKGDILGERVYPRCKMGSLSSRDPLLTHTALHTLTPANTQTQGGELLPDLE